MPSRYILPIAALSCATAAAAAQDGWSFAFGQGVAEYSVNSFDGKDSNLSLSCAEAGVKPGSVSISLARAGFTPRQATRAVFTTDTGEVAVTFDCEGWAEWPSLAAAPDFRKLWRLLATAETLRVSFGPGKPLAFPVANARQLFGGEVCPRQLAE